MKWSGKKIHWKNMHQNQITKKQKRKTAYLGNQLRPRCSVLEKRILSYRSYRGLHCSSRSSLESSSFFLLVRQHMCGLKTHLSPSCNTAMQNYQITDTMRCSAGVPSYFRRLIRSRARPCIMLISSLGMVTSS